MPGDLCREERGDILSVEDRTNDGHLGFDPVGLWRSSASDSGCCQKVHERVVGQSQLDVGQVQADEIKAKIQGGVIWMAMAIVVSSRLWLGGEISRRRDKVLIEALVARVRAIALCRPVLVAVDGLPSYVGAFYPRLSLQIAPLRSRGTSQIAALA